MKIDTKGENDNDFGNGTTIRTFLCSKSVLYTNCTRATISNVSITLVLIHVVREQVQVRGGVMI